MQAVIGAGFNFVAAPKRRNIRGEKRLKQLERRRDPRSALTRNDAPNIPGRFHHALGAGTPPRRFDDRPEAQTAIGSALSRLTVSTQVRRCSAYRGDAVYFFSASIGEGAITFAGSDRRKVVARPNAIAMMRLPARNGVLPYSAFGRV
jgi:hypothetical protein